jgi:hypothetical protein
METSEQKYAEEDESSKKKVKRGKLQPMRNGFLALGIILLVAVGFMMALHYGVYVIPSSSSVVSSSSTAVVFQSSVSAVAITAETTASNPCATGICTINGNTVMSESAFCSAYEADTGDPCDTAAGTEFMLLSVALPSTPLILNLGFMGLDIGVLILYGVLIAAGSLLLLMSVRKKNLRRKK